MKIKDTNFKAITARIEAQLEDAHKTNKHYITHFTQMKELHAQTMRFLEEVEEDPDLENREFLNESLNTLMEEIYDLPGFTHFEILFYIIHYYTITEKA